MKFIRIAGRTHYNLGSPYNKLRDAVIIGCFPEKRGKRAKVTKVEICKPLIKLEEMPSVHGVETFKEAKKKSPFHEYISSKHWKEFREVYRASGRPKQCSVCGSDKYQLHHLTYDNKWNEGLDDVMPLCWDHHRQEHRRLREVDGKQ